MSTVVERIGEYAARLKFDDLNEHVIDYAKRIVLDSLACVFGGLESDPARIVRETLQATDNGQYATVYGKKMKLSAQSAALANGVALRYQDYNDVYFGSARTAHPSDNIATLLAVAEWQRSTGRDLLTAVVAAYEVQMRFSDLPVEKNLWHYGWHHTMACAYAAAAGVGTLLGLDGTRLAHAIALSGARSNTLAEIRHGAIPMDKALSAPIVASQAITYALLAQRGFTGCMTLLEGPYGFGKSVARGVDVEPLVPQRDDYRILKVSLKPYPVEGMTPAMVQAAIELKNECGIKPDEVSSIRILAHEEAVTKPSWDEHKLKPTSKETADHSFFYCVAVALVAGEVTSRQFSAQWLENQVVLDLIAKTRMEAKPELTALFKQGARPAAVEVTTPRGVFQREVLYPHGDPHNPMSTGQVTKKFHDEAGSALVPGVRQEIVERTLRLEQENDLSAFAAILGG